MEKHQKVWAVALLSSALFASACDARSTSERDAGTGTDAGILLRDSGMTARDAGMSMGVDAGPPDMMRDAGMTTTPDAGPRPDGGGPTGEVGSSCTMNEHCTDPAEATCETSVLGIPLPGGYCSRECTEDTQCGTMGRCVRVGPAEGGVLGCVKPCELTTECRTADGYTCGPVPLSDDTRTYCVPPS